MKKYLNLLCIAVLVASCAKDPNADEPVFKPTELTRVTDLNKAAFSFFNSAEASANGKSFVISPANISILLGMEANINAEDWNTIKGIYGFGTVNESNEFFGSMIDRYLYKRKGISASLSNAVFCNSAVVSENVSYTEPLKKHFGASVYFCDFSKSPETSAKIAEWIKNNTGGITDISDLDIDKEAGQIVAGTISFKGEWKSQFKTSETTAKPFTISEGNEVSLPTMSQTLRCYYTSGDKFESVLLYYGQDSRFAMRIILPKSGNTPAYDDWYSLNTIGENTEVHIELPKFETEFTYEQQVSGLDDFVCLQSAKISIDEKGGDAAAATASTGKKAEITADEPVEFIANKPFYYVITDAENRLIYFIGYYNGK